jgi:hypothetical protein
MENYNRILYIPEYKRLEERVNSATFRGRLDLLIDYINRLEYKDENDVDYDTPPFSRIQTNIDETNNQLLEEEKKLQDEEKKGSARSDVDVNRMKEEIKKLGKKLIDYKKMYYKRKIIVTCLKIKLGIYKIEETTREIDALPDDDRKKIQLNERLLTMQNNNSLLDRHLGELNSYMIYLQNYQTHNFIGGYNLFKNNNILGGSNNKIIGRSLILYILLILIIVIILILVYYIIIKSNNQYILKS